MILNDIEVHTDTCGKCGDCDYLLKLLESAPSNAQPTLQVTVDVPYEPTDEEVDAVARVLFRAFDDVNIGLEPLHDYDVMTECDFNGRPVVDKWHAMARTAIALGARRDTDWKTAT